MSERTAAFGANAPPKTIEHAGKVYTIAPVVTEGTMARVEAGMYGRAKKALTDLRADMPEAAYMQRLDALRTAYEAGEYSFESERTLGFLQTTKGALLLLSAMMTADEGEVLDLLTQRPDEVRAVLDEALAVSFPDAPRPKAQGRPGKKKRPHRAR